MSVPVSTPGRRRWRRWHVAVLAMLCTGAVALTWVHQRIARVERLVAEIKQPGGHAELGTSPARQVWERIQGWSGASPTRVRLAAGTTQEWLRSWNSLSDLSIKDLHVDQGSDLGPELARLVVSHPLEGFYAPGATGADELAAALANSQTLSGFHVRDSDLTDAGLRQLPLEQLRYLNIAGTQVTADGLRELQRLPPISMIVLDGRQATAEVVTMLEQSPNPYRLWLFGPDVTDDTLQTVKAALVSGGAHKLASLYVGQREASGVSESAMLAWQRDVPSVRIAYTQDAEPGPPLRGRGYTPRPWSRWFGK